MVEMVWGINLFVDFLCVTCIYMVIMSAQLKYNKVKSAIVSIVIVAILTVLTYNMGADSRDSLVFIFCVLVIFIFSGSKLKWLSLYLPSIIILSVIHTLIMAVLSATIGWSNSRLMSMACGWISFGLIGICYILNEMYGPKRTYDYSITQTIILNVGAVCLMFLIGEVQSFLNGERSFLYRSGANTVFHNAMLGSSILLCILVFYMGVIKRRLDDAKKNAEENEFLLKMQQEQMDTVIKSEEKLHAFKHDLIAHLNALSGFAAEGDLTKVKDYCETLLSDTSSFRRVSYTGNPALDGVLGQLKGLADEKGVELDIKMTVPKEKKISDYDLCILVSNIIKNAIEANNSGGKVDIKSWPFNENLCIMSSNTTTHPLEYKKGVLLSTKRDYKTPGYGMRNINAVIDKYDGDFQIRAEGDIIKVEALV